MTIAEFDAKKESILDAMVAKAKEMGVVGVAVVANLEDCATIDWRTAMRVVGATHIMPSEGKKGYNYIGVVYAKASEMMDTFVDSGTAPRDILVGELGYRGGAVCKDGAGAFVTAFSGGTSDEDYEISTYAQTLR